MKFPIIRIYLEKPNFYDVNRDTWWSITDKVIKWFQWILFIAVIQVGYERTKSISIEIVWYVCVALVFRATLAFFQVAIRMDINGVKDRGVIYYVVSVLITFAVITPIYIFAWKFAGDIFSAFVDFQKAH
jgi:hypothetical protein